MKFPFLFVVQHKPVVKRETFRTTVTIVQLTLSGFTAITYLT